MASEDEEAFVFDSKQVLDILHNSVRVRGGNDFTLPVNPAELFSEEGGEDTFPDSFDEFVNSEEGSYYVGALTASICLLVFYIIWLCVLPCSRCFCKAREGNNCLRLIAFFITLNISILGWFLSLTGLGFLKDGVNLGSSNAASISSDLDTFSADIDRILEIGDEIDILKANMTINCQNINGADTFIQDIPGSAEFQVVAEPQEAIQDISPEIDIIIDRIEEESGRIEGVYKTVAALLIVFLIVFNITTVIAFFCKGKEGCIASLNDFLNRLGCIVMFSCGIIFVTVVTVVLIILAPLATIGSDACTPSLVDTITTQVEIALNEDNVDFCALQDFEALSETEQVGWFTCHYSTCVPGQPNLLLDTAGINLDNEGNFESIDIVKELEDDILLAQIGVIIAVANGVPGAVECQQDLNNGLVIQEELLVIAEEAVNRATCSSVTPLLESTVNDGACNGMIAGIGAIFVTGTLGVTGLMLALCIYVQLDFKVEDKKDDVDYPFAFTIDEEVESDNPRFSGNKF